MTDELKIRIQKLQALAERGVGGEKDTAQKKLEKLLKDNGLTLHDLEEDKVDYYLFSYNGSLKRQLLCQIMYKTLGAENFKTYHSKGTRNKVGCYCTAAQKIEIELDFEFYSNLFDEEANVLLKAFVSKQDLYPEDSATLHIDATQLSPEALEEWNKLNQYRDNIKKRTRSLLIEQKD